MWHYASFLLFTATEQNSDRFIHCMLPSNEMPLEVEHVICYKNRNSSGHGLLHASVATVLTYNGYHE
jgi:hypothetical protein